MITVVETTTDHDLRPLSRHLWMQRVPHRIHEASGRLLVSVPHEQYVEPVERAWAAWERDELAERATPPGAGVPGTGELLARAWRREPAVLSVLLVTLAFFPVTWPLREDALGPLLPWLLIVRTEQVGEYLQFLDLVQTLSIGEVWRLWTPALLHFTPLHLVFNMLWLWEFGRRIELGEGGRRLIVTILVIAPVANLAQYGWAMHGPEGDNTILFGGMSGVVYGLLGYVVTAWRKTHLRAYQVHGGLVIALLVLLVLLSTGVTTAFGLHVANAAHWGGLVAGIVWAQIRVPPRTLAPPPGGESGTAEAERSSRAGSRRGDDET